MSETVQESEISLTIMSDKLTDTGYIDQMLVTTKLQILGDISKTTNRDLHTLVEQHCKEAFDYPELVEKYKLPVNKSSNSSKPSKPKKIKLKMRRSKKSTTAAETTTPDPVVETTTPKSPAAPPQPEPVEAPTTPELPVAPTTPEPPVAPKVTTEVTSSGETCLKTVVAINNKKPLKRRRKNKK